jgi:hypothetical protein
MADAVTCKFPLSGPRACRKLQVSRESLTGFVFVPLLIVTPS